MKVNVFVLNSFIKDGAGGNPAGVVLDAKNLASSQMLQVAKIMGFSETAFVLPSKKAGYRVRFFTPVGEVDLCGHATITTFFLLKKKQMLKASKTSQETNSGVLEIEVKGENVFMQQNLPEFYQKVSPKEIAKALNVELSDLREDLPPQVVSTGVKTIIVLLKNLKTLLAFKPDFSKISKISKQQGVLGIQASCRETNSGSTAHCRNFSPLCGIDEEAACGTDSGSLSCYLFTYGEINSAEARNISLDQGYTLNNPCIVLAKLATKNGKIQKVQVGGTAKLIKEICLEI